MTVYIVHDNPYSAKNFNSASEYGVIQSCVRGHVSMASLGKSIAELEEALQEINKNDWLILTGHPVLMAVAANAMAVRTGWIKMLVWDNQTNKYYPYEYFTENF